MQIEISGELETLIRSAIASGRFTSAEEFIETAVRDWRGEAGEPAMPTMRKSVDADTLLREQGIGPCADPVELGTDIWPADESTDDFLRFLRQTRRDSHDRAASL